MQRNLNGNYTKIMLQNKNKLLPERKLIRGKYCCRYRKILTLKVAKHWQNKEINARTLKHKNGLRIQKS